MTDKPTTRTNAPLYANLFASMVPIAREHGYALAVHGSVKRDLDLIAVPWVETPSTPQALVDAFTTAFYFDHVDGPAVKLHGRMVWTLAFPGECFVDLSVMPVNAEHSGLTLHSAHAIAVNRCRTMVTDLMEALDRI